MARNCWRRLRPAEVAQQQHPERLRINAPGSVNWERTEAIGRLFLFVMLTFLKATCCQSWWDSFGSRSFNRLVTGLTPPASASQLGILAPTVFTHWRNHTAWLPCFLCFLCLPLFFLLAFPWLLPLLLPLSLPPWLSLPLPLWFSPSLALSPRLSLRSLPPFAPCSGFRVQSLPQDHLPQNSPPPDPRPPLPRTPPPDPPPPDRPKFRSFFPFPIHFRVLSLDCGRGSPATDHPIALLASLGSFFETPACRPPAGAGTGELARYQAGCQWNALRFFCREVGANCQMLLSTARQ